MSVHICRQYGYIAFAYFLRKIQNSLRFMVTKESHAFWIYDQHVFRSLEVLDVQMVSWIAEKVLWPRCWVHSQLIIDQSSNFPDYWWKPTFQTLKLWSRLFSLWPSYIYMINVPWTKPFSFWLAFALKSTLTYHIFRGCWEDMHAFTQRAICMFSNLGRVGRWAPGQEGHYPSDHHSGDH